jgi:hypothetical protein
MVVSYYFELVLLLFTCGFIVRPRDGCSGERAPGTGNPRYQAGTIVGSVDVVSRLKATFVCPMSYG